MKSSQELIFLAFCMVAQVCFLCGAFFAGFKIGKAVGISCGEKRLFGEDVIDPGEPYVADDVDAENARLFVEEQDLLSSYTERFLKGFSGVSTTAFVDPALTSKVYKAE